MWDFGIQLHVQADNKLSIIIEIFGLAGQTRSINRYTYILEPGPQPQPGILYTKYKC